MITDSGTLSATGNVTLNDAATQGITLDTLQADANVILTAAGNTAITNDAALNLEAVSYRHLTLPTILLV